MKKSLFLLLLLPALFIQAQNDITGAWYGKLNIQNMAELRLVFHIEAVPDGIRCTMDSPDQKAFGIPVAETKYNHPELVLNMPDLAATFKGKVNENFTVLEGIFEQAGLKMNLKLNRQALENKPVLRPQEPKPPYPYYSEDVSFQNVAAGITLSGTLTLPSKNGKFPVVILVSGSGPQDRNEELFNHKPFLVLTDHLTRKGIGVLRYDDRGFGKSTGNFEGATSEDFASDVQAAIKYLLSRSEVDSKFIGIAGHSEGGLIAPMVAAKSKNVGFIILLAAPGVVGKELMSLQAELIMKASGYPLYAARKQGQDNLALFNVLCTEEDLDVAKAKMEALIKKSYDDLGEAGRNQFGDFTAVRDQLISQVTNPWMRYFLCYDPAPILQKVKCPVLAVNGEKDVQVDATQNLMGIENALKKAENKKVTVMRLPNLNHLFQTCQTGSPTEYGKIEETMSPVLLNAVSDWILSLTK